MNLMLFCAGEGTRLRPHTLSQPKPAIPFLGVPLAAYSLEWAREIGVDRLVVNLHHLPGKIRHLFSSLKHGAKEITFSDESDLLMGSGGGLKKAESSLKGGGDFLVMNGDEVFFPAKNDFLKTALKKHQDEKRLATLFVMDHPEVGSKFGGVWTDQGGKILGFHKKSFNGAHKGWHFIGAMIFSEEIFKFLPEGQISNILYDGVTNGIAAGLPCAIEEVTGWWRETGNEVDFLQATKESLEILSEEKKPFSSFIKSLLDRHQPGWKMEKNWLKLPASFLEDSKSLLGFGVLGEAARVPTNARAENSVLGSNVILQKTSDLKNQLVLVDPK